LVEGVIYDRRHKGDPIHSSTHFNALLRACTSANELHKLHSALKAGWTEDDLADFARWHFGTPFIGLSRRKLMAIINSALSRDYFARRFMKEREQRAVSLHAARLK
jgi:hypothetical protein